MGPNVGNGEGGPAIVCETVHPSSQLPPGKVLLGPCMHLTVLACGRVSVDVGNVVGLEPDVTANLLIRGGERLQPVSLCRAGQGDAGRGGAGQGGAGQGGAGQGRAGQGRAGRGLAPNRACMGPLSCPPSRGTPGIVEAPPHGDGIGRVGQAGLTNHNHAPQGGSPFSPYLDHVIESSLACDGIRASTHDEELDRRAGIARARRKIRRSDGVDAGASITRRSDLLGSLIRGSGSDRA